MIKNIFLLLIFGGYLFIIYILKTFFLNYISEIPQLIVGIATIFVTIILNKQTSKISEDNLKANCYSEIIIRNKQYFEEIGNINDTYYNFNFKIADKNQKILSKIIVREITIREHDSGKVIYSKYYNEKIIALEYTPETEEELEFYLARIEISKDIEKILEPKYKSLKIKIEIDADIINVFNVATRRKYILVVENIEKNKINSVDYITTKKIHDFSINPTVYYCKK